MFIIAGGFNIGGDGQTVVLAQNTYVFQDTVSWIRGRSTLCVLAAALPVVRTTCRSSYSLAIRFIVNYPGLLLGQAPFNPFVTQDLAGITQRNWRVWDGNLYAQDDIKVTSRSDPQSRIPIRTARATSENNGRNASMDPR